MKLLNKMTKKMLLVGMVLCFPLCMFSCGGGDGDSQMTGNENVDNGQGKPDDTGGNAVKAFAKGADVSWLTEMEKANKKFYDAAGNERECMALLKNVGFNAIRLRVWVNPADGWCDKNDVLVKARRAAKLGLDLMIDFHYADSWADPGKQPVPAAWQNYSLSEMKTAVAGHTTDVLQALKDEGIAVKWVQVGNETNNGMLWPMGQADKSMSNYAALTTAGYDAVKTVYPDAKVIVHLANGHEIDNYTWIFNGLKQYGGKWDVIGMSLYADEDANNNWFSTKWQSMVNSCAANIRSLANAYQCEVMVCEVGARWDDPNAKKFVSALLTTVKDIDACLGVFYWEPQCLPDWKGYNKGAFDKSGRPTSTLDAFMD